MFLAALPVFTQLFQRVAVEGGAELGEGPHQTALEEVLALVQLPDPALGLGLHLLQALGELAPELPQGLQPGLKGLSGLVGPGSRRLPGGGDALPQPLPLLGNLLQQIGRASCRERV